MHMPNCITKARSENKTGPKEHGSVIMWLNAYFCPMLKLKLVEESPGVAQVWFNLYRS